MLGHSGGEQGFVGDEQGTFWSLDRYDDFAARSAVIAAIEEGDFLASDSLACCDDTPETPSRSE
jgi:hypothetical protein